jgi:hypothetical protein
MGARLMDQKLAALFDAWRARPFAWGCADCTTFARDAAWRLHGLVVDVPAYVNEREAVRLLADHYRGWSAALQRAGFVVVDRAPLRGDLVMYESTAPGLFAQGLAVCFGAQAFAPGAAGLLPVPAQQWVQTWVPCPKGGA